MKKFIQFIKSFFGKPKAKFTNVTFIQGSWFSVQEQYRQMLNNGIEVISTTITQDFTEYGNTKCFILVVTYKQIYTNN